MIQRFLIAAIAGFLVLTSQIITSNASAADIDWDSVPHFANKAELATYIENGRRKGQTEFHFVFLGENISNKADSIIFLENFLNTLLPLVMFT